MADVRLYRAVIIGASPSLCQDIAAGLATEFACATANSGGDGLGVVRATNPDLVLIDLDLPDVDGFSVCERLKDDDATYLIPVILLSDHEPTYRMSALKSGADDLVAKPINFAEFRMRARTRARLKQYINEMERAESVILCLARGLEERDPVTGSHCARMASLAQRLGLQLGCTEQELITLRRGAYLHDIGKIGIPDQVLQKPGRLTTDEFAIIKRHPEIGEHLLRPLRTLEPVLPIVRHHHERFNGSGYPDGISGTAVPLLAQIIGIIDVYDALISDRPYRGALPHAEAIATIQKEVERKLWNPLVADTFFRMIAHVMEADPQDAHAA